MLIISEIFIGILVGVSISVLILMNNFETVVDFDSDSNIWDDHAFL